MSQTPSAETTSGITGSTKQLAQDIAVLVRSELQLAREEIGEKAQAAALGAGMLSGSALTGVLTLGSLTALMIIALTIVLPAWLSALIVTALWGCVTGILALSGKNKITSVGSLLPTRTLRNVKEDVRIAKRSAQGSKD